MVDQENPRPRPDPCEFSMMPGRRRSQPPCSTTHISSCTALYNSATHTRRLMYSASRTRNTHACGAVVSDSREQRRKHRTNVRPKSEAKVSPAPLCCFPFPAVLPRLHGRCLAAALVCAKGERGLR
eukprot:scaffold48910_cov56-Phaeocystis_antarctica.AAC.5